MDVTGLLIWAALFVHVGSEVLDGMWLGGGVAHVVGGVAQEVMWLGWCVSYKVMW